jgi:hypothetical protein
MAKQVQLRRGTTAELSSVTGAEGEVIADTTKDTLTYHDGYTAGGIPLLREDVGNLADQTIPINKIVKGTANQVLITNSAGTALEWGYANNASALSTGTLSSDRMEAGAIIQVVNNKWNSLGSFSYSTSSSGYTWTGSTTSITPKRSGSWFHVHFRLLGEVQEPWNMSAWATRNGSRVNSTQVNGSRPYGDMTALVSYGGGTNFSSTPEAIVFSVIDTAGSIAGTPISYECKVMSDASRTIYYNRTETGPDETFNSEVIIMEIAQ